MPYAVTHVILTIIAVDLYRDYFAKHKKYFTLHTLMIAGVASMLPDIDILVAWVLNALGYPFKLIEHGGITHTPFFVLLFIIPAILFYGEKKHKMAMYFFVASFAVIFHIFLDYLLGGGAWEGVMWFWPLSAEYYKIHLLHQLNLSEMPAAIDAGILLLWLWHEEAKHKIKDFF